MAKNFIQVARTDGNAIFSGELLSLIASLRSTVEKLEKVKSIMDCNWATTDFTDLELRFGLLAGQGQTVYGFVRDTQRAIKGEGTFADALTLISRVG